MDIKNISIPVNILVKSYPYANFPLGAKIMLNRFFPILYV